MQIVIGNKNYSSWSLRGWLALHHTGVPFEEIMLELDTPEFAARIGDYSPAGRVPVLVDGAVRVWDSLAIIEYLAEKFPAAGLWPADPAARALARSVVAEMHSGFGGLRNHYPMNIRRPVAERPPTEAAAADIARVTAIWRDCRARFGAAGPYLFGAFSAADCFYAPVASRLRTYGVAVGAVEAAYVDAIFAHPGFAAWAEAGRRETTIVPSDEVE